MLEFEIRPSPKVHRPMSGLVALHQKIPLLQKLALDSYPDSKMLEKWLKRLDRATAIAPLASDFCRYVPSVVSTIVDGNQNDVTSFLTVKASYFGSLDARRRESMREDR